MVLGSIAGDIIACIAGGIAHIFYHDLLDTLRKQVLKRLDDALRPIVLEFCEKHGRG